MENIVNKEIKKIEKWFLEQKLSLNTMKSSLMLFGENKNSTLDIYINNDKIPQTDTTKYLGVTIDKQLNWKSHIEGVTADISKYVGILYYLKKYLSTNNLKMVYNAVLRSRLQYGIVLWGNANQSTLRNLNTLHNRAIRYITKLPIRTNLNLLYSSAELLKIKELYKYSALKHMFTLNNKKVEIKNMTLVSQIHKHNTRLSKKGNIFLNNNLAIKSSNSVVVNCIKAWNDIPSDIRAEKRKRPFNKLLYNHLLHTYNET